MGFPFRVLTTKKSEVGGGRERTRRLVLVVVAILEAW